MRELRYLQRSSGRRGLTEGSPDAQLEEPADVAEVRVALDLLGGDHGADVAVEGALAALARDPRLRLVLVGPDRLRPDWEAVADRVTLLATEDRVGMSDPPVRAVKRRSASVRLAVGALRRGLADAVVSVGPTGATVAAAVTELGKLPGIRRPVLAAVIPAVAHPVLLVDVGAHTGASEADLIRHARLGAAYARVALGVRHPRVGLLSVGTEPGKGDPLRRRADRGLANAGLEYVGLVEGYDVPLGGRADVVVTDGFTGNVVLKTLEGALALAAVDPARSGGSHPGGRRAATLLGVAGTVVVGHGAASAPDVADCLAAAGAAARGDHIGRVRVLLERTADPALDPSIAMPVTALAGPAVPVTT